MQASISQRVSITWPPSSRPVSARRQVPVRAYLSSKKGEVAPPTIQAANQLESLRHMSKVVADTGEIKAIKEYMPVDCTTNPSLVLKAMQDPEYVRFLDDAVYQERRRGNPEGIRPYSFIADQLAVNIGTELLSIVPGRVSTEVDAHLSHDTLATVDKALHLVDLYVQRGIDPDRLYIKIASTWEGIRACEVLQQEGIDCNMTLLFSFAQAAACADAGAALISPFVGRILDWHKKANPDVVYTAENDPGVESVKRIYKYYKAYNYNTIVMAASFRNADEIRALAGCDNITIAPPLLKELEASKAPLPYQLWPTMGGCEDEHHRMDFHGLELFDKLHGEDLMAVEKLKEGIDNFAADQLKLEEMIGAALKKANGA
ncbi:Transaldolase [Micractinium conductrix]|uniref:Transaldolase n=1 Tax=Micractinium conductrix TaxID=554055 RepID=A0A2P6V2X3_9CHLO|nr:Transaldolase [Micractinium conductrix]|eukprot:PSC68438.1 Transaldolase [Micractinium conductrix]